MIELILSEVEGSRWEGDLSPMKRMMAVKPKIASLIVLVLVMTAVLSGAAAYADSVSRTIHLTITVVGVLSLNIDENTLSANSEKPEAEAFSEIRSRNIAVSKLVRDNSNLWLFTKTE